MGKAVIFDFDGVLVDSESYWPAATRTIFETHARKPWTEEDCRSMTGLGMRDCHAIFTRDFGMEMSLADYERYLLEEIAGMYDTHVADVPGARQALERLRVLGIPMAVASSNKGDVVRRTLRRLGMDGYFAYVASSDDVGERVKPLPDVYLVAAGRLGTAPSACVAVEDSSVGVAAAKAAGMACVAVLTGHNAHQRLDAADAHVTHFDEFSGDLLASLA